MVAKTLNMKKITTILLVIISLSSFGQDYTVLDSTITVDRKLKAAYQIKHQSYDLLKKIISQ